MKKLVLTILAGAAATMGANAGGGHWHHGHWGHRSHSSISFHFGTPYRSCYSPLYSPSYVYYPRYSYPAYGYAYDYGSYSRPNYAVGGTLLGALAGGIIGHNVNRQGWEGAGIGAAAGLVLGGVAESSARSRERAAYSAGVNDSRATYSYSSSPAYSTAADASRVSYIADSPTVNTAATVPDAPRMSSGPTYRSSSSMSGANRLFGR